MTEITHQKAHLLCRQAEALARTVVADEALFEARLARTLGERILALFDDLTPSADEDKLLGAHLAEALAMCDFAGGNGALPNRLAYLMPATVGR